MHCNTAVMSGRVRAKPLARLGKTGKIRGLFSLPSLFERNFDAEF
jgi:hypothetical protein